MKFIPGKTFINRTENNTRLFSRNKLYILHDIKKLDSGQFSYTFLVDNKNKEIKFESLKQAEDWLDTISI